MTYALDGRDMVDGLIPLHGLRMVTAMCWVKPGSLLTFVLSSTASQSDIDRSIVFGM